MKGKETIRIGLHAARSTGERVIWAEIEEKRAVIRNMADLKMKFGNGARLSWFLITNGIRQELDRNDPRIEQEGFLLRIPEKDAVKGVRAECVLST